MKSSSVGKKITDSDTFLYIYVSKICVVNKRRRWERMDSKGSGIPSLAMVALNGKSK